MREIDDLIEGYLRDGWASGPFERMLAVTASGATQELIERAMAAVPNGSTWFDAALSFLPVDEFDGVVDQALNALAARPLRDLRAAEQVISEASLQAVESLHPRLDRIWDLAPNERAYYAQWPWRGAADEESRRLARTFDQPRTPTDGRRAWASLVHTRTAEGMRLARERADRLTERGIDSPAVDWFALAGYDVDLRRICAPRTYHLRFERGYLEGDRPAHLRPENHPTWFGLGDPVITAAFGGLVDVLCAVCGHPLHRLLDLPTAPDGLGITSPVTFATCLSCLGWAEAPMFFRHAADGTPSPVFSGEPREPEFPSQPFEPTTVGLVPTPPRWRYQDWGHSNGRQNLNRLGGEACWIQAPDHPACPTCMRTMTFVLQLDSDVPPGWLWGSGGIAYVLWCDGCAVSATTWQCT